MLISLVSVVLSLMAVAISYMALVYTAKPRVVVELVDNQPLHAGQEHDLQFRVKMGSRIKKAAADLRIYVNFVPQVEPINARYGSALELETTHVRTGKGPSRYVVVTGIRISRLEPIPYEDFVVRARMPNVSGTHKGWVTIFAYGSADDCGVSHFSLTVT
jgi:hypothetical protein